MAEDDKKWSRPANTPSPQFLNQKERDFVKNINDETIERIVGQSIMYYAVDHENTNFDDIYGEAIVKNFFPPMECKVFVEWEGLETTFEDTLGPDKRTSITVRFQRRRINDELNLFVREGDYILYGGTFYEVQIVSNPTELFGHQDERFEVVARCLKARQGEFDAT